MKLNVDMMRYMTTEEFRVLTAVEMGMKNHELVSGHLVESIAGLRRGGTHKLLSNLLKNKLVAHDSKPYDGYRLTYPGYDILALKTIVKRGHVAGLGRQIGVGKESDIYTVVDDDENEICIKLHRLGRTSFRTIKTNRDYLVKRKSASWLYMSRLAALKEYAYMVALHENGFPVPRPIDQSRHVVCMELVRGYPMQQIAKLKHPGKVYSDCMNLILKLASYGLIHCDFNEFNLLINDKEEITLIDFPQMVSTSHPNAKMYFQRDVDCIRTFFERRFGFESGDYPTFEKDVQAATHSLDKELHASGFTKDKMNQFKEIEAVLAEASGVDQDRAVAAEDDDEEDSDEESVASDDDDEAMPRGKAGEMPEDEDCPALVSEENVAKLNNVSLCEEDDDDGEKDGEVPEDEDEDEDEAQRLRDEKLAHERMIQRRIRQKVQKKYSGGGAGGSRNQSKAKSKFGRNRVVRDGGF